MHKDDVENSVELGLGESIFLLLKYSIEYLIEY